MSDLLFQLFDLLGIISFSISGAMVGVKKQADLFGVIFLGVLTAVGGGIMRDAIIGSTPPVAFTNPLYIGLAALSATILFCLARFFKESYIRKAGLVNDINGTVDAIGLGLFSVMGVQVAHQAGYESNLIFCVFLGMTTGIGGGIIRDVMVREIPFVLRKRIYAVASIGGALCYHLLTQWGVHDALSALLGTSLVFVVRVVSTKYKWNLPRALR